MSYSVRALKASQPRNSTAVKVALVYATILVMMVVGQLFSFEKFLPLMQDYWLPGGKGTATLVACVIVFCEVFALPFLLRMALSPLMRWFSLVCAIVVPTIWLALAIVVLTTENAIMNSGMLGTKVVVPAGIAQLLLSLVLVALAAYSAWGLWPTQASRRSR